MEAVKSSNAKLSLEKVALDDVVTNLHEKSLRSEEKFNKCKKKLEETEIQWQRLLDQETRECNQLRNEMNKSKTDHNREVIWSILR